MHPKIANSVADSIAKIFLEGDVESVHDLVRAERDTREQAISTKHRYELTIPLEETLEVNKELQKQYGLLSLTKKHMDIKHPVIEFCRGISAELFGDDRPILSEEYNLRGTARFVENNANDISELYGKLESYPSPALLTLLFTEWLEGLVGPRPILEGLRSRLEESMLAINVSVGASDIETLNGMMSIAVEGSDDAEDPLRGGMKHIYAMNNNPEILYWGGPVSEIRVRSIDLVNPLHTEAMQKYLYAFYTEVNEVLADTYIPLLVEHDGEIEGNILALEVIFLKKMVYLYLDLYSCLNGGVTNPATEVSLSMFSKEYEEQEEHYVRERVIRLLEHKMEKTTMRHLALTDRTNTKIIRLKGAFTNEHTPRFSDSLRTLLVGAVALNRDPYVESLHGYTTTRVREEGRNSISLNSKDGFPTISSDTSYWSRDPRSVNELLKECEKIKTPFSKGSLYASAVLIGKPDSYAWLDLEIGGSSIPIVALTKSSKVVSNSKGKSPEKGTLYVYMIGSSKKVVLSSLKRSFPNYSEDYQERYAEFDDGVEDEEEGYYGVVVKLSPHSLAAFKKVGKNILNLSKLGICVTVKPSFPTPAHKPLSPKGEETGSYVPVDVSGAIELNGERGILACGEEGVNIFRVELVAKDEFSYKRLPVSAYSELESKPLFYLIKNGCIDPFSGIDVLKIEKDIYFNSEAKAEKVAARFSSARKDKAKAIKAKAEHEAVKHEQEIEVVDKKIVHNDAVSELAVSKMAADVSKAQWTSIAAVVGAAAVIVVKSGVLSTGLIGASSLSLGTVVSVGVLWSVLGAYGAYRIIKSTMSLDTILERSRVSYERVKELTAPVVRTIEEILEESRRVYESVKELIILAAGKLRELASTVISAAVSLATSAVEFCYDAICSGVSFIGGMIGFGY